MSRILYGAKHDHYPASDMDFALHGTEAGARAHWRRGEKPCRICREAHNRRQRERNRRNRAQGLAPDDHRHGVYGYNSFNCRCDKCLVEGRQRDRNVYRRNRSRK